MSDELIITLPDEDLIDEDGNLKDELDPDYFENDEWDFLEEIENIEEI
jgi:hypothetical protein